MLFHRVRNSTLFKHVIHRPFSDSRTTDFGFKNIPQQEKEDLVKQIFSRVASKYDVMNDVMSMGAHRLWKDEFVHMIGLSASARSSPEVVPRFLDVAGGTGDIAFRIANEIMKHFPTKTSVDRNSTSSGHISSEPISDDSKQVVVFDINPQMLSVGRDRALDVIGRKGLDLVGFVEGNAESLPFEDQSFDQYTIAFGLRNVTDKEKALREAYRVLRKGGRLMIMEFSQVNNPILRQIYDQYSFQVIPKLGRVIANDEDSYQYLVESIRRFPNQENLAAMVSAVGFGCVSYRNFSFGAVAVHSGFKL